MPLIDVPLTPRFLLKSGEKIAPTFKFQTIQTHNTTSIQALFASDDFKRELHRTPFSVAITENGKLEKQSIDQGLGLKGLKQLSEAGKKPINLTEEEVNVLFAFAITAGGEYSQGGLFSGFQGALIKGWLERHNMMLRYEDAPSPLVQRDALNTNILVVSTGSNVNEVAYINNRVDLPNAGKPALITNYRCQVMPNKASKDEGGVFVAEYDKDNYTFKLDETIWREVVLKEAAEAIQGKNYDLVLMQSPNPEIDENKLSQISKDDGPIVIRHGDQISIYGFSPEKKAWGLTLLDAQAFKGVSFPETESGKYFLNTRDCPWAKEIALKKGHVPTLTNKDLFRFIPCLCDPKFTKAFAKKLADINDPDVIKTANNLIGLCFEHRPKDLLRIAKEFERHKVSEHLRPLALLKQECASYQNYLERQIENELTHLKKALKKHLDKFTNELIIGDGTGSIIEKIDTLLKKPIQIQAIMNSIREIAPLKDKITEDEKGVRERLTITFDNFRNLQAIKAASFDINWKTNEARLQAFALKFLHYEEQFKKSADPRTDEYIKNIKIILSTVSPILIPVLGLAVVAGFALHSKWTKDSFQFWKTREKIFSDRMNEYHPEIKKQKLNNKN